MIYIYIYNSLNYCVISTGLKLGHLGNRSQIPEKFRYVVLEKDGEGSLERSSET